VVSVGDYYFDRSFDFVEIFENNKVQIISAFIALAKAFYISTKM